MTATINVPRILEAMKNHGWLVVGTCVNCKINNKTLAKVLKGEMPRRLDAFYRLLDGLGVPIEEALIGGSHQAAQGSRLRLVSGGRPGHTLASHD